MADSSVAFKEIGTVGLTRFGGHVSEEWLRDLQGTRGMRIYKEMRDNDAIVGAFLWAVEMLLKQVDWTVERGGDTPQDIEAAEFLDSCLKDMSYTWQDTLSEILSMLPFGWAYMETVYKKRVGPNELDSSKRSKHTDGRIGWRKWALRAQETLFQWKFDDEDGVLGLEQQAPPIYDIRFIPIEKALLFRTKVQKSNPEGRSILRNAYRSWYMKKNMEEIEAIGVERDLAGLPVMWLPAEIMLKGTPEATASFNEFKKIVTNIRRDEQEGVMMPLVYDENKNKMYDLTLLSTGSRRQFDTNMIVQRYDQRVAMTVLADFILLGHEKVGSFALSSDKTNMFSIALGAVLGSIRDTINTHAVPRLFALNDFGKLTKLPQFKHGDIETPDLAILGEFISKLSGAQMPLFPDDKLENYLRTIANLPEKPAESKATPKQEPAIPTGEDDGALDELEKIMKAYDNDRQAFMAAVVELQQAVKEAMRSESGKN